MSVTPIRPGVAAEADNIRELIAFAAQEITEFGLDGDEAAAVAIYIRGKATSGVAVMTLLPGFGLDDIATLGGALMTERARTIVDD